MNTLTIILLLTTLGLALALYLQMRASREQSEEGSKLLDDYQKRVDEQEKLQSDYRDLEKHFDNMGEGYEQALLMYDKMEENTRNLETTNKRLEEQNADLLRQKTRLEEQVRKASELLDPVVASLQKETATLLQHGGADRKAMGRLARLAARVAGIAQIDKDSKDAIEREDNIMPEQIATLAVEQSGIHTVDYLKFELQVSPYAASMMVLTNQQAAADALTELLDNAQKFTTEGRVSLRVNVDTEGTTLIFVVEDTGMGIPAADAERVFEKGVRLNTYFDGSGLGLTIARSIARRMGGDLVLDTSYAAGARFTMTLPI